MPITIVLVQAPPGPGYTNMMVPMMSLCLLLQTLHYCTASSVDCEKLVEGLNRDTYRAAKEVGANWNRCRSAFFKRVSKEGISRFFTALKVTEPRSLTLSPHIAQDIAKKTKFASNIHDGQLKTLITRGAIISPSFFANVPGIENFNKRRIENWELPKNLLSEYDGPMKDTTWITGSQFKRFGVSLDKDLLCNKLEIRRSDDRLFAFINVKCLRGLLKRMELRKTSWALISSKTIKAWINHFEEDCCNSQIVPGNFSNFSADVWVNLLATVLNSYCQQQVVDKLKAAFFKVDWDTLNVIDKKLTARGLSLAKILNDDPVDNV